MELYFLRGTLMNTKGCIFLGLLMLLLAVIAVIARILVFLFGPERLRVASSFGTFKLSEEDT